MKHKKLSLFLLLLLAFGLAACGTTANNNAASTPSTVEPSGESIVEAVETTTTELGEASEADSVDLSTSAKVNPFTEILGGTNWQGTIVVDANGTDLTEQNANFIGLAKYDSNTNRYEFFDAESGETRGDSGVFFVTNDGNKRILISQTNNYQAVVDLTELTNEKFTYKRMGKDAEGNDVEVFVEHIPYAEKELVFTTLAPTLNTTTGPMNQAENGDMILGKTLWNGTVVKDEAGNNLTEYNQGFISLAKYDSVTNQYEFFDLETGETRGDFGYFAVINQNKERAHASIGENKYGAVLEITELNDDRFTYKRQGKNAAGEDVTIYVEHEPYTGTFVPSFTF